jgi:hypothetical protein
MQDLYHHIMREIHNNIGEEVVFDRFKAYFLVTKHDIYKLQCVNNSYAQDPDKVEYAFCPFSYSCAYFGGHIGDATKIIKSILSLNQGRIFESTSTNSLENLYLLLIDLLKRSGGVEDLDKIKYVESEKAMHDVGYIKALLVKADRASEAIF